MNNGDNGRLLYNFAKGHPNVNELPGAELQQILGRMHESNAAAHSLLRALQYGNERGNPELIGELRKFLDRQCAEDKGSGDAYLASASSFFITEGVSHGIDLLSSVATRPGDLVLTERPTYFLVAGIFHSHDLTVDILPMRSSFDSGVDVDKLEEELELGSRPVPRLIYIIPAYQNPTGRSMLAADRRKLANLAAKFHILVVADEVYHLLDWGDQPRSARMVTWNPRHHFCNNPTTKKLSGCVSVSSLTKIFGPGVRCGWIEAESDIIDALTKVGYIQSQGGVGPVIGSILTTGLEDRTIDRVLTRLRKQYQKRCNLLCDVIDSEPDIELLCRPLGGYFVWIRFPERMGPVDDFLNYCLERGVNFMPGQRCDSSPDDASSLLQSHARLCFAKMDAEELEQGSALLLACFQSYMESK